mmetsp:Transcript_21305/g.39801  ORF Transcript_21305/g.39801 Transcript_21305/m.39801 type:complete len:115 (-) Transcript_21305:434-778(-)
MGGGAGSGAGGGAGKGSGRPAPESWSSFHGRHHSSTSSFCGLSMCTGGDDSYGSGMMGKFVNILTCSDDDEPPRSQQDLFNQRAMSSSSRRGRFSLSRSKSKRRGNVKISSFCR